MKQKHQQNTRAENANQTQIGPSKATIPEPNGSTHGGEKPPWYYKVERWTFMPVKADPAWSHEQDIREYEARFGKSDHPLRDTRMRLERNLADLHCVLTLGIKYFLRKGSVCRLAPVSGLSLPEKVELFSELLPNSSDTDYVLRFTTTLAAILWLESERRRIWLSEIASPGAAAAEPVRGPLRVRPTNPRYFTDGTITNGSLKAVYLTGSHTWANLIDRGPSDPPPVFDFSRYLDFLVRHRHNFIRLWGRHVSWYHEYGQGELHARPLAWWRTGPGKALDGKPRFDLTQLNSEYFQRLRSRVKAAGDRGIYVGIMLFGGSYECRDGWRGNPFHRENNINGINGDPLGDGAGLEGHTLAVPAITRLQEAYVRKVIDAVNALDNVLYEIANEADETSVQWQYHLVRFIQKYEATLPKQHPVGMTALYIQEPKANDPLLLQSGAQWIAPLTDAAGVRNIPAADGAKVRPLDSDHWFVKEIYNNPAFGREWVWKAFCRGYHAILMENLPPLSFVDAEYPLTTDDPGYKASRQAMGDTGLFAERMNLEAMQPNAGLSSTGYCLACPGSEYLVYQPEGDKAFSVELEAGTYHFEWFDTARAAVMGEGHIEAASGRRQFEPPFAGEAVLYLKSAAE